MVVLSSCCGCLLSPCGCSRYLPVVVVLSVVLRLFSLCSCHGYSVSLVLFSLSLCRDCRFSTHAEFLGAFSLFFSLYCYCFVAQFCYFRCLSQFVCFVLFVVLSVCVVCVVVFLCVVAAAVLSVFLSVPLFVLRACSV